MTISEILVNASKVLQDNGIDKPRREASLLLEYALQKDRIFLIAHPEYELEIDEEDRFRSFVERRANREPFHYIVGVKEFYGLDFDVSPDVLIPRPETEMLVANSIEILQKLEEPTFCEVGVGSACIAVSILHNVNSASAVGLDISEGALRIAKRNAEKHGVSSRLELRESDIFSSLRGERFELVVSNPPYIPSGDMPELRPDVKDFEPRIALTDGGSGLSIVETIIKDSPKILRPDAFLLLEIGIGQAARVRHMFDMAVWEHIEILPDFQTIPRMVRARLK